MFYGREILKLVKALEKIICLYSLETRNKVKNVNVLFVHVSLLIQQKERIYLYEISKLVEKENLLLNSSKFKPIFFYLYHTTHVET